MTSALKTLHLDINTNAVSMEVYKVIFSLKNGKSVVLDGLQAELLKTGGTAAARSILSLCNQAWESEKIPIDWRDSILIPLPKKC